MRRLYLHGITGILGKMLNILKHYYMGTEIDSVADGISYDRHMISVILKTHGSDDFFSGLALCQEMMAPSCILTHTAIDPLCPVLDLSVAGSAFMRGVSSSGIRTVTLKTRDSMIESLRVLKKLAVKQQYYCAG